MQPKAYDYLGHLLKHIDGLERVFSGIPVWPRQIYFCLPGDHKRACNFHCAFCAGQLGNIELGHWEDTALDLMDNMAGAIPYHMYSGYNSENLLNPYLLKFIEKTKQYGNCYGLKTNGSLLLERERQEGFMTALVAASDSPEDFISVSLDAGFASSHAKIKRVPDSMFAAVCDGVSKLCEIRGDSNKPAVRLSYLLCPINDSVDEIRKAIRFAEVAGVDSIRFSQPHPVYGLSVKAEEEWRKEMVSENQRYEKLFEPLQTDKKPFVFYAGPSNPKCYRQCIFGYYQIALAPDGYLYRCICGSNGRYPSLRLGKITSDLGKFARLILSNQDPSFNPQECFRQGVYCCRAGIAVNEAWQARQ